MAVWKNRAACLRTTFPPAASCGEPRCTAGGGTGLSGFRWWINRLARQLELFDLLRLDHFRALEAYWSVPGGDTTAENGSWRPSPGRSLLRLLWWKCLRRGWLLEDGRLPLIAEDLGVITPPVEELRDRFSLPGMKILQFAFDGSPDNPYLPDNFKGDQWVVYTGTHDNATSVGWWHGLDGDARGRVAAVVGERRSRPRLAAAGGGPRLPGSVGGGAPPGSAGAR